VSASFTQLELEGMGKVFVSIALSLDGFMAPEGMTIANWDKPERWAGQWSALMQWALAQASLRQNLKLGPGGETGRVNDLVRHTMERTGANIMGKRMFEQGEISWPEEAPFHTPVYVLTKERRDPWSRPGGTTFHFVNDGPESALEQARSAAGERDVRISGGANVIQQYLNLGVVEEMEVALAPVLFHRGRRLFENLQEPSPRFRIEHAFSSPSAAHLRYLRQ
jgi:dihydrofolate reductase